MRGSLRYTLGFIVAVLCLALALLHMPGVMAQKADAPAPSRRSFDLRTAGGETIRFKPETGEAWVVRVERLEIGDWKKIKEAEKVPAGDYDIVVSEKSFATRIDRTSGTTWWLKDNEWVQIKEPK